MIHTLFNCQNCGKHSYGYITDRGWKLELHCPHCLAFVRHVGIHECWNFRIWFGKFKGDYISDIAETKKGVKYLEWLLENQQYGLMKDWHRFVIDSFI